MYLGFGYSEFMIKVINDTTTMLMLLSKIDKLLQMSKSGSNMSVIMQVESTIDQSKLNELLVHILMCLIIIIILIK